MELSDINVIAGILSRIKINKIADTGAKDATNKNFIAARRALRPFEKDKEELAAKFREDWKKEIEAILSKREGDYSEYYKAEAEMNNTIVQMLIEGKADVKFIPVKAEFLLNPDIWDENDTLGRITNTVDFLIKNGIAEE